LHFACDALGIDPLDPRGLTVTGGLPYHGGPGSGYLVHAIATLAESLRADPGAYGLVSGVGMHMTKHMFGVYSTTPGPLKPSAPARATASVPVAAEHSGSATVAAYSVVHGRDGAPAWTLLVCDLDDGDARSYARVDAPDLAAVGEARELVGATVRLTPTTVTGPVGEARVNMATW
jgi:acetyl-CoA C-acetyltransferase